MLQDLISEADLQKYGQSYTYQTVNGARQYSDPTQNYVNYGFGRVPIGDPLAGLQGLLGGGNTGVSPAPAPPHFKFTFDTIGQVIYRSIGNCRLPLRTIWAKGISESGDSAISNTQTFASAVCSPIDPLEEGEIFSFWDGGDVIFNTDGVVIPAGWTPEDAALLAASLSNVVTFPGNESQLPADLIVADKGADRTNAFRRIRYFIFPDYPIRDGGIPQLSVGWARTSPEDDTDTGAVEFLAGGT